MDIKLINFIAIKKTLQVLYNIDDETHFRKKRHPPRNKLYN